MGRTVGKYPSVNTLSRLVLPQAPSPIMTSFLGHVRWSTRYRLRAPEERVGRNNFLLDINPRMGRTSSLHHHHFVP
jgi:hypothetical protein